MQRICLSTFLLIFNKYQNKSSRATFIFNINGIKERRLFFINVFLQGDKTQLLW